MDNITLKILNIEAVQALGAENKVVFESYLRDASFSNKLRIFNLLESYPETMRHILNAVYSFQSGESLSLDGILESLKQEK
jgi:hypothetical protein